VSKLTTVQLVQAILAIVLGVLGLPQAGWVAWELFSSGLFGAFSETLQFEGLGDDPFALFALVNMGYGIAFETTLIVLGLVTSAAAIVGGAVALTGRLNALRWAALAILLYVVVIELGGHGLGMALALVQDFGFAPPGLRPSFVRYLRYFCNPLVFAFVRAVFWGWTFMTARAQKLTAQDVRPA